ncbi:uncharacterized protein LOC133782578 [Humulus lupulus]|uniref:uncharacterized protein LOC133782578 n=1 Tax=Humulus lupulus TaxID=3486 RepID=UPI002B4138F3|nr:uncharacterized protein LOC133782578 [Humulus lupulus]
MKNCELCGLRARMYCESDRASLCWDCDEKVHGANFLVAKHSRSLLCHVCNSPTPWMASGAKLTPTVSVCESCVDCHNRKFEQGRGDESQGGNDEDEDEDEDDTENDDDISDDDDDNDHVFSLNEDEYDEDGENQVVPWSFSCSCPPPMAESSSGGDEDRVSDSKRLLENADLHSDNETGCSQANDEATSSVRPSNKRPRLTDEDCRSSVRPLDNDAAHDADSDGHDQDHDHHDDQTESRSTAIITSLQRLQKDVIRDVENASNTILGICKLSRDQSR